MLWLSFFCRSFCSARRSSSDSGSSFTLSRPATESIADSPHPEEATPPTPAESEPRVPPLLSPVAEGAELVVLPTPTLRDLLLSVLKKSRIVEALT